MTFVMTWVDLAVFGFLGISGLMAFARGFVREILGVGAWVGAVAAAFAGLPAMRDSCARLGAVAGMGRSGRLFSRLPGIADRPHHDRRHHRAAFRRSALGGVDRTLGLVFGLARGAASS